LVQTTHSIKNDIATAQRRPCYQ